MTEKQKDDVYYVCSLIEYIARKTKNHRQDIIHYFSKKDIDRQLRIAEVNHCLSFEQVSDEIIEDFGIKDGKFDTVKECKYEVPSVTSIGMLYQELVLTTMKNEDVARESSIFFHRLLRMRFQISIPVYIIQIRIISGALIWRGKCWLDSESLVICRMSSYIKNIILRKMTGGKADTLPPVVIIYILFFEVY